MSGKLRILIVCYEYPPVGGGGARVVSGLAREFVREGHEVDVVTMAWRDSPAREVDRGVRVRRVACLRRHEHRCNALEMLTYILPAALAVRRLLRAGTYDVVNTHFILPDGLVMRLVWPLKDPRLILTAHGSDVPGYNPDRFKLLHRLLRPLWRSAARAAACVVSPSATLEGLIRRQDPALATVVIPNGLDAARFATHRERAPRILVVSRAFSRKGIQHLVQAFLETESGFELHIVGDGPHLPALKAMSAGARQPVRFWGWLDNGDPRLRELYETSAIFCLPSEAENFPICLLEAMAAGLAIITTADTGCADVVGDEAILVPAGDVAALRTALVRLMEDPALRRQLGDAAERRLKERFTWPAVARMYLDLYRRAAGLDAEPAAGALEAGARETVVVARESQAAQLGGD